MADPFLTMVAGVIQRGGLPFERLQQIRTGGFVTSVTFSGLDGNADGAWLLVGQYAMRPGIGDVRLSFLPNGIPAVAGDTSFQRRINDSLTTENNFLSNTLRLIDTQSQNGSFSAKGLFMSYISCSAIRGAPRFIRTLIAQEDYLPALTERVGDFTTKLSGIGATNITSFDLVSNLGAGIGPNSEFTLFRVPTFS